MGFKYYDRVKETTTTTGTGTVTLAGAPSGFSTFSSRLANGDSCAYCIALGTEWEVGEGTLTSSTTFTRDSVLASSNSDALVSFSAGSKDIFITIPSHAVVDHGLVYSMSAGIFVQ
jgi:hypothetical protein